MSELNAWVASGKHLPPWLQDFHDQKDLFKTIQSWANPVDREEEPDPHYSVTWVQGHTYTIDTFLRFMALHGFTLQRSRKKVEFCDLDESIKALKEEMAEQFRTYLEQSKAEREAAKEKADA